MNSTFNRKANRAYSATLGETSVGSSVPTPTVYQRSIGLVYAATLRLLAATWRVQTEGLEILDELAASNRRHILAFWHQHYITLFRLLRDRPIVVVTNQSGRGQIIANICHRTGMQAMQFREKGNKGMLQQLDRATAGGLGLGIAVDGPLGPAHEVKRVVPHLAAKLACPIVPISVEAAWKYRFAKRWDHLEIPYLFSRVKFVIRSPIDVMSIEPRLTSREVAAQVKAAIELEALTHLRIYRV